MNHTLFASAKWIALFACTFCTACADYAVTLNDNPVYTPKPLFSDYVITDDALKTCVQQNIADQKVRTAAQLTMLKCSHAGIESLAGLQVFTALQRIDLSNNALTDLNPLASLKVLVWLKIDGNNDLPCKSLGSFNSKIEITRPKHCSGDIS